MAAVVVIVLGYSAREKASFLPTIAWILALLGGLVILWKMGMAILSRRYRLTSQRLFIDRGVISRTTDQTELIRVDDVRVHQSLFQRMFNLGDVTILSTDVSDGQITLTGIEAPGQWAEDIRKHMRVMRKKSLFVENL